MNSQMCILWYTTLNFIFELVGRPNKKITTIIGKSNSLLLDNMIFLIGSIKPIVFSAAQYEWADV